MQPANVLLEKKTAVASPPTASLSSRSSLLDGSCAGKRSLPGPGEWNALAGWLLASKKGAGYSHCSSAAHWTQI